MRWLPVALMFVAACGCSSDRVPTYPVTGRVQFSDGEPVRTGTVEFESEEFATTATGSIQDDGTFVLGTYESDDGAAVGKHRAIVVQIIIADGITKHTKDHGRAVPPRYADYSSSGLSLQVEPIEQNELIITLRDET